MYLYRNTFSLSVLAIDGLFGGFGCYAAYVVGIWLLRKLGYNSTIKLAFGLWALVSVLTAVIAGHVSEWYIAMAVLRAFPGGLFAASTDAIMLREVGNSSRQGFLQLQLGIEFVATVILPAAVGALISFSGGYQWTFLLAALIYCSALVLPMRLAKPQLEFDLKGMLQTFRRPLYGRHATNRTLAAGFNQTNAFVMMIIPFLLLKNELKIGILTSAIALIAAGVSFAMRKLRSTSRVRAGYAAYMVRGVMSLAFVFGWSAPLLFVWQLVGKVMTPLHDPLQKGLDFHNDSLILGEELQTKALHINVLNNTLLLVGTTIAYGGFYYVLHTSPAQQQAAIQALIVVFVVWRFANLALSLWINKTAQTFALEGVLGMGPVSVRALALQYFKLLTLRFQFAFNR